MITGVPSFSRTFLFTLLATTASTACNSQGLSEQIFTGSTMGTTFRVSIIQEGISDTPSGDIRRTIEAELDGVDRMMSHYRPDSELSRFNAFRDTQPFSFTTVLVMGKLKNPTFCAKHLFFAIFDAFTG